MLETSDQFKQAIYAPERLTKARVRFEILDVKSFQDNTKEVTTQASISRLEQVTNKVRKMSHNYGVFEKDYFKLDGSFIVPPEPGQGEYEVGWWSGDISDEQGNFDPHQKIEFVFGEEYSSMGLTIYFDILNNEYAKDFDIDVYDSNNEIIKHHSIIDNTKSLYVFVSQLSNYKRIVVTVKKWSKPYRRVKLAEVDFGVIREYTDDDLIKVSIIQELNTTSKILPADEVRFTIDNASREFNILNPNGFYEFLQQGQEVFAEIGVELDRSTEEVEFIQVGKYYLKDWQSDEGTLTASFTARNTMDFLSNIEVEGTEERNLTLYDLAIEVLEVSEIQDYILSDNLKHIYTKGLHPKMTYRNLLQLIVIAGMCVCYTDNTGALIIKQLISAKTVIRGVGTSNMAPIGSEKQAINNVLYPTYNFATFEKDRFKLDGGLHIPSIERNEFEVGWVSNNLSNDEGVFEEPTNLTIDLAKDHASINFEILFDTLNDEYPTEFNLKAYDLDGNVKIDQVISNNQSRFYFEDRNLENARKLEIKMIKWCRSYRRARVQEIAFDIPLDNITFDNIYKEPQINLSDSVRAVEVTYYPTNLEFNSTYIATDDRIKEGITLKVDNPLINTIEDAQNVAEWILRENTKRAIFKTDWRGNPAHSLTDKVSVEDGYGGNNVVNIVKQEFHYEGYLRGKTELKGMI